MGATLSTKGKLTENDFEYLSSITYCTAKEVKQLYKEFLTYSPKGHLNRDHFYAMYKKFCPTRDPRGFCDSVFRAFDTNDDGWITFNEFLCAINASCLGTAEEKLQWVFRMYDLDGDGVIGKHELIKIIEQIYLLFGDDDGNIYGDMRKKNAALEHGKKIFGQLNKNNDYRLSKEEFVSGTLKDDELTRLLTTNTFAFVRMDSSQSSQDTESTTYYDN